ncbi:MAG: SCP2 sterol-binding domain-containing protein [Stackebrandtia sp.]
MTDDDLMGEVDLTSITPTDFARLVRNAPEDQLGEVMSDPDIRGKVLDEVFSRMGGQYAGNKKISAVVHWKILDRPGGGYDCYETVLESGGCVVNSEPRNEPRVTVKLTGEQFLKLASGNGSPTTMFFTGKLKLSGDIGFAAGLSNLFNIPKA